MEINEDDITDLYWDWLTGEPINKKSKKLIKKLRKNMDKSYLIIEFITGGFLNLKNEYEKVIDQIINKNLTHEFETDGDIGFELLKIDFIKWLLYGEGDKK